MAAARQRASERFFCPSLEEENKRIKLFLKYYEVCVITGFFSF
jgi:hypothetical protein